jgi:glycerol-3-phosphate dehydrogenase subunit B
MRADVVVVGAGLSGLAAAAMLAEAGRGVTVVARGNGFTHWGAGAVDVLGSVGGEETAAPAEALPKLPEEHPYRLTGEQALRSGLDALVQVAEEAGLVYTGSLDANRGQVTALGTWRTTCLVPQTAAQPLAGSVAVVGLEGFRDFSAELCAQGLRRAGLDASAATVPLPSWGHERNATAVELARAFDEQGFRDRVADAVARAAEGADVCVMPAVLGVRDGQVAWAELQARAGLPVVEAAIPPPSIPGLRLYDAYRARLERLGVRWMFGFPAVGVDRDGDRVAAVRADGAARQITIRCEEVVLAAGGVAGGGIHAHRDGSLTEAVANLPVEGFASRTDYVTDDFLAAHPLGTAGVRVDGDLRPLDGDGRVALQRVRCAGSLLAGHDPTTEGCREGVAVATAARLAELLAPTPSAVA